MQSKFLMMLSFAVWFTLVLLVNCETERRSSAGLCRQVAEQAQGSGDGFIPQCDEEGNFLPMQRETRWGQRWCVDRNGVRIDETLRKAEWSDPICSRYSFELYRLSQETACMRARTKHIAMILSGYMDISPCQCDVMGRFRPRQSRGYPNGQWCVDSNGVSVEGTYVGHNRPPTTQPPPDCSLTYEVPPTACIRAANSAYAIAANVRPTHYVPQCTYLAQFNRMQVGGLGEKWCVDENGNKISGTETAPDQQDPDCQ